MNNINIKISDTKPTIINWPNQVKQIVDGYRSYSSISHGIQKDAIQNSWDARLDKKYGKGWGIEFELIETKDKTLFTFTDKGTTGLTGKILMPEDLEQDLQNEERWGRFENVAFTKNPTEHALGARGRGKFIFVGASGYKGKTQDEKSIEKLILYDSLRSDKIYRFGLRFITITDSRLLAYEGNEAESMLKKLTDNLTFPLKSIGTRVIIVDPLKEIVDDLKNGKIKEYIEETWWEIIKNYDAKITIKIGDNITKVKLSNHFKFPQVENKRFKIWKKENIKLPKAPNYKIEKLKIIYDSQNTVEENLRGVFIQRGGMKVCSIPIKYIDKTKANSIYGYIKLNQELESKMQEDEGIEHYSFDFSKQIPKFVKQYIEDEIEKFLREKLGIDIDSKPKTYEKEKSAELKALYQVNAIAKQLGILGSGILGGNISTDVERKFKPLRISYGKFGFPADTLRVNYNDSIKNIRLILTNETEYNQKLGVRFSIVYDEDEEVLVYLDNNEYLIKSKKDLVLINNIELFIDKNIFVHKGKYTFHSKLVALNIENRGEIIHKLTKHFWVEENPPQKGIFEDIEAVSYPEELRTILGEAVPSDGKGYKFLYNNSHPAKKEVEKDEEKLTRYLIELMCTELAWIDLRNEVHKIFSEDDLENSANTIKRLNKFLGEIKFKII